MTSADRDALRTQLIAHEGVRWSAYQDSRGFWTIGVGRLIDARKGGRLSDDEVRLLLDNDINEKTAQLASAFPWFPTLDVVRQIAYIDLAFMGIGTLLTFEKMNAAAARGDWATVEAELLDSDYAKQVGQRAVTLGRQLRTGKAV